MGIIHDISELVWSLHWRDTSGSSYATASWRDFFEDLTAVKTTDMLLPVLACTSFMHCLRTWCTVALNFIEVDHRNSRLWVLEAGDFVVIYTILLGWKCVSWRSSIFEDSRMVWRIMLPGIGADGSESILSDWNRSIIRDFRKIFANHQQLLVSVILVHVRYSCPITKMVQA